MKSAVGTGARRGGFTLLEMLVVIALIVILSGMLVAAMSAVKQAARSVHCMSNLRNVTYGLEMFFQEHDRYPGGGLAAALEGYLKNQEVFLCAASGRAYEPFYVMPVRNSGQEGYVVSCPYHGRQTVVHTLGSVGRIENKASVSFDGVPVEAGETAAGTKGEFRFEDGTTVSVDKDTVALVVASMWSKEGICRSILRVIEGKNKTTVDCAVPADSVVDIVTPAGTAAFRRAETEAVATALFDSAKQNQLVLQFGKAATPAIVPLLNALESAGTYRKAAEIMSSITPRTVDKPQGIGFADVIDYFVWRGDDPLTWNGFNRVTAGTETFEKMELSDPLFGECRTEVVVSAGVLTLNGAQGTASKIPSGGMGIASAHSLKCQRAPKSGGGG